MTAPSKKKSRNKNSKGETKFNKASKKQFKGNRKDSNDATKDEAVALQLEDDVPDFPRGGGGWLSRKERDDIAAEVDAEFEAEKSVLKKTKKTRKRPQNKSHLAEDDFGSLFGDGLAGKLPRFANKITLKNISPGMKLWGVVAEVNEKDLVISLPGGLRGLVRPKDALDPIFDNEIEDSESILPRLFYVGQLVSCIVLQLEDDKKDNGKRKIWLSLRLSLLHKGFSIDAVQEGMVLSAYVKSIEDHGYILHFGLPSFTGFLAKDSQAESRETKVKVGKLLEGVVRRIDKSRKIVYLTSEPETVSKCVVKDLKGISIDLLSPGMMVNARVNSTLENGIMLSFLTYFTGTVDLFHLQNIFSSSNWKDDYQKNKKVNARIIFIDPSTRAVGLTLNQHLVHKNAPPFHVKVGDIYDNAKVVRVDRGLGILLEVPSLPASTATFVSVSDVAEDGVQKLEKKFKEGSKLRVRILGRRHLEGLGTGISKASAFEGPVFTHSDVKPGMIVRAKIVAVDRFGAIVQFPGGVKALCPLRHMSEFEIVKPRKKFKVGAELLFRVLGCKSKRITVTHKKSLVKSKLPILSSYTDANNGLVTHGWITKIEKHGCFVHFYNGVQGFVPRSELGLEQGSDASSMYHVEQVVKCKVIHSVSRRIILSFVMKRARVSEEDAVKLGSVIPGIVEKVTPFAVILHVNASGYWEGRISIEHLADHRGHASLMMSLLKPGYEFDQLLVLDIESDKLILSAKHSLINSAQELPSDFSQIHPHSIVPGYICNIIDTGCFVRFLGRLTGFSPRSKALDDQRIQLTEAFYVGQSVCSNILDVNSETSRITVSLKQSCCKLTDTSFLHGYFLSEEKIAQLQLSESQGTDLKWLEGFDIGSVVEGKIQELKEFGVVVSFAKYNDVVGFLTHYQLGGTKVETGSHVQAVVLDIAKTEHLVDLSLKPEFLNKALEKSSNGQVQTKNRKRKVPKGFEVHQTINAIVEIVKENYLVLSIPEQDYAIGYASISDYNTQKLPPKQFLNGQSVIANVMALPSPSTAGRLLLSLTFLSKVTGTSSLKKAKKKSSYNPGSLVQAEITEIKPLEMRMKFGIGFRGRIHITEVNDSIFMEDPFSSYRIGQTIAARIIAKPGQSDTVKGQLWELSIRPKILTDSSNLEDNEKLEYSAGQCVSGYVYKVDRDWAWLTISRYARAQLFITDSSFEPDELHDFQKQFHVGKVVSGYVLSYNKEKALVRLVLHPPSLDRLAGIESSIDERNKIVVRGNAIAHIQEGNVIGGRISKILQGVGGLLVQVSPNVHGRVHFTELQDSWVSNPLSEYHEGQFVKCKVLEISRSDKGTYHIDLSLRSSLIGMVGQNFTRLSNFEEIPSIYANNIEELHADKVVQGYVKNVTSKGCFILLSRKLDAKILISNLSDGFVESPEKEFPVGKLVMGKVLSVEPLSKRVEVTLKSSTSSKVKSESSMDTLHVGDIINGRIKRVEPYGLFIAIDDTNMVGLCHVSELSDDRIHNIESKYRAGEEVRAKILKVDRERHRISLQMKNIREDSIKILPSKGEYDEADDENGSSDDISEQSDTTIFEVPSLNVEFENEEHSLLAEAESRASIPALEVSLDDLDNSSVDDDASQSQNQDQIDVADAAAEKNMRKAMKKGKEYREREIRAAEERLLANDIPRTADEFEKLVRNSPNSSFVWIKYMAFMLSLADIEKARSLAERALRTINIREENEKLNVWLAYFNLENQYGSPPEEAVKKIFQRALQYCDPKKVHLALLGMYERTEQHRLADELLDKMVKKFKHSCKVWLHRIQRLLKQGQEGVHYVVQRAILCLPRHKHIKFISQTAILEFKCGVPDRGRSMFEGILREYPKRTDLWSIYLDQEIRIGDVDVIRTLFERATSLSLPPKKMKFLFKKYLEYEKSLGDVEHIEAVKRKAMEYVENTMTG
ncbi:hypothetical protein K2173_005654 [Erythroxylum novogranatense]|uniref:Protein RRP5 homolog n=1 Tax=Erythroxylum novogranatense TaxID=1862640 RepID=A0AAV8SR09_9ROSI|nr:hypothetical protein K2173_005654 [Erythroxylum novogranatense]